MLAEWVDRLRAEVGDGFPEKVTAFHPEMAVHGKHGQPCPVCGAPVQRIVHADDEDDYCPRCQTGGRILADSALSRLLVISESYPQLRSNENFLGLQDEIASTENALRKARTDYNRTVEDYNRTARSFPMSAYVGILGFKKEVPYFEAPAAAREAPKVDFSAPAAAPTILTGMRISMGIAWLVIVAAEMLVGGTGIGYFVWNEWNNLSLTNVLFAILMIGVVGMALDSVFGVLSKRVAYQE